MVLWLLVLVALGAGAALAVRGRPPEESAWDVSLEEPGDAFAFQAGRPGPPPDLPSRTWSIVRIALAVLLVAAAVAALLYAIGSFVNGQIARMLAR